MNFRECIKDVRESNPLIHSITNQVVANDAANALLAIGASPIMALAVEEVEEVAALADALVLNMGTPTSQTVESMLRAGEKANERGVPVILDPVGVGATQFRQTAAKRLFEAIDFTVIRGNAAEIASLTGRHWESKGVDSIDNTQLPVEIAEQCARENGCIVAVSGVSDLVTDGEHTVRIDNGVELLGAITGSGCMLSGIIGALLATREPLTSEDVLDKVVTAHVAFGVAAEKAVESGVSGPGTFRAALIDALAIVTDDDLNNYHKIERISK
ncbi:MAG: hydroxyethylthiazole kinase [Alkalibacterium sp.]|nr:hydroxyethylthiazole kinase [Alkalibacterium sp.]